MLAWSGDGQTVSGLNRTVAPRFMSSVLSLYRCSSHPPCAISLLTSNGVFFLWFFLNKILLFHFKKNNKQNINLTLDCTKMTSNFQKIISLWCVFLCLELVAGLFLLFSVAPCNTLHWHYKGMQVVQLLPSGSSYKKTAFCMIQCLNWVMWLSH